MGIKILWTDFALFQLEEIYDFYKIYANTGIAKKLVKSIVEDSIKLQSNPFIGAKEPLLAGRIFEYRYLVKQKHKIIYRFNNNLVTIISVFDTRQNPRKIESLID
jgi:toxin ParE1/3/4